MSKRPSALWVRFPPFAIAKRVAELGLGRAKTPER